MCQLSLFCTSYLFKRMHELSCFPWNRLCAFPIHSFIHSKIDTAKSNFQTDRIAYMLAYFVISPVGNLLYRAVSPDLATTTVETCSQCVTSALSGKWVACPSLHFFLIFGLYFRELFKVFNGLVLSIYCNIHMLNCCWEKVSRTINAPTLRRGYGGNAYSRISVMKLH